MAKGQKRSTKEVRKPKKEAPKPAVTVSVNSYAGAELKRK